MSEAIQESDSGLERFRNYLLTLARLNLGNHIRSKVDASDVVQRTLLEAHCDHGFVGKTEGEIMAWLRTILAHVIAKVGRDLGAQKRDVGRERSLEAALDASAKNLEGWLAADQSSPSARVSREERMLLLVNALARLPEHYRQALVLRHCQGLALQAVAEQMKCSRSTVAGFLNRGSQQLRHLLGEAPA